MEDFLKDMPPQMRERLMPMTSEERERMIARRRARLESMDEGSREAMKRVVTYMRQRSNPPEIGSEAPDLDLAILDGDGARVRLRELRGRPVGSYSARTLDRRSVTRSGVWRRFTGSTGTRSVST